MKPSSLLGEVILGALVFYLTSKEDFFSHLKPADSVKKLCINFASPTLTAPPPFSSFFSVSSEQHWWFWKITIKISPSITPTF